MADTEVDNDEMADTSETIAALEGETIPGFEEGEEQEVEQMDTLTEEAEAEHDKLNLIFNSKAFKEKYGLAPGDPGRGLF